jgi:hypothetical protein
MSCGRLWSSALFTLMESARTSWYEVIDTAAFSMADTSPYGNDKMSGAQKA